jgi:hypothetical protein
MGQNRDDTMATYTIDHTRGPCEVTGEPVGPYLGIRRIDAPRGIVWSIDHRPSGRRVLLCLTRADARAVARVCRDVLGDALANPDPQAISDRIDATADGFGMWLGKWRDHGRRPTPRPPSWDAWRSMHGDTDDETEAA